MTDWQVGDYALCVTEGPIICPHHTKETGFASPPRGAVKRVSAVGRMVFLLTGKQCCNCQALQMDNGSAGIAMRFIKVTPTPEQIAAESAAHIKLEEPV